MLARAPRAAVLVSQRLALRADHPAPSTAASKAAQLTALSPWPKNQRSELSPRTCARSVAKEHGKTSTQGGTIEHRIHTQMSRIKIPEDTRREGPPFPRIQGTSSSNCHGKILTLERRKGNQQNKKETDGGRREQMDGYSWLPSSLYFIPSNSLD